MGGGGPLGKNKKEIFKLFSDIAISNILKIKKVWLFTRYELMNVPEKIKQFCDYIKGGKYIKKLSFAKKIFNTV